jgi:signal peptidase
MKQFWEKYKKLIKKIVSGAITFLCALAVVLTCVEVVSASKDGRPPRMFGYSISYVPTDSMEPTISVGDYVLFKKITFDEVNENDIIIYRSKATKTNGMFIIHRVMEKHDTYLIVQGDNNIIPDKEQVTSDMVYGIYLDDVGFLTALTNGTGRNTLFVIIFVLFAVIAGLQVFATFVKGKKEEIEKQTEDLKKQALEEMKAQILKEELERLRSQNNKKQE